MFYRRPVEPWFEDRYEAMMSAFAEHAATAEGATLLIIDALSSGLGAGA